MFGKSKLQKILSLMESLTEEELATLLKRTDKIKVETDETISESNEKENTEEETSNKTESTEEKVKSNNADDEEVTSEEVKEEAVTGEEDKTKEVFTAIEALKDTVEALATRMDAYDNNAELYREALDFGLSGRTDVKTKTNNALDRIKEKYWNI